MSLALFHLQLLAIEDQYVGPLVFSSRSKALGELVLTLRVDIEKYKTLVNKTNKNKTRSISLDKFVSRVSEKSKSRQYEKMTTVYVVNYADEDRRQKMVNRFAHVLPRARVHFSPGTSISDPMFQGPAFAGRPLDVWVVLVDHLANIRHFYESKQPYALFCEDDTLIDTRLETLLPSVFEDCKRNHFDVVLLASLLLAPPLEGDRVAAGPLCDSVPLGSYYGYGVGMWGAHMYVLSRPYAAYLLEKYTLEWALNNGAWSVGQHYCSDWTITKDTVHRALLYPPLGVEEGVVKCDDADQINLHRQSHLFMYEPHRFV